MALLQKATIFWDLPELVFLATFESPVAQSETMDECCACDEAKYEMIFEGIWSRQTHPKDFPTSKSLFNKYSLVNIHFFDSSGASDAFQRLDRC